MLTSTNDGYGKTYYNLKKNLQLPKNRVGQFNLRRPSLKSHHGGRFHTAGGNSLELCGSKGSASKLQKHVRHVKAQFSDVQMNWIRIYSNIKLRSFWDSYPHALDNSPGRGFCLEKIFGLIGMARYGQVPTVQGCTSPPRDWSPSASVGWTKIGQNPRMIQDHCQKTMMMPMLVKQ